MKLIKSKITLGLVNNPPYCYSFNNHSLYLYFSKDMIDSVKREAIYAIYFTPVDNVGGDVIEMFECYAQ